MKKFLQVANVLSVIFTIAANAFSATASSLPGIGTVSAEYATLLNPATYAFSIWSVIFFLILCLAIYQARDIFSPNSNNVLPEKMGGWFIGANLLSGAWTYIFISDNILLSFVVIASLLFCLAMLIKKLRIALDLRPLSEVALVWWPIQMYAGWVAAATVVNSFSVLASRGITPPVTASLITLIAFSSIISFVLWKRNTRMLTLASTWGIVAIAVAQYGNNQILWISAALCAGFLLLQTGLNAYQNRSTGPFAIS